MPHVDKELGEMLRAAREKAGLSQNKAAKNAGIGRKSLADAENGRNLGWFSLKSLAATYGVEIVVGATVSLRSSEVVSCRAVEEVTEEIEKRFEALSSAVARLRSIGAPKREDEDAALNKRAANLIQSFTTHVRANQDESSLQVLETAVHSVVKAVTTAPVPGKERVAGRPRRKKGA